MLIMELITLGTGAAWPDADRSAPAFLVRHDGIPYLIDCGGGVCHQLMKIGCKPSEISNILLTHIHIDHCVEFPSLVFGAYLTGKVGGFNVYGPMGIKHFTTSIFDDTYNFAKKMMKSLRNVDIDINSSEFDGGVILEENGLIIDSLLMNHGINTLAYRFTANGKKLVFSSDTAPCDNLTKIAENADVLVIECSFPESFGIKNGHCIPSQIGAIAEEANAKSVILTHLFPVCKGKENEIVLEVKKIYSGEVTIASDLQLFII
jgi:ribonuclease Z